MFGTIDEMLKSDILLVWNLHGGDNAMNWTNSELSNTHNKELKTKERIQKAGGAGSNKGLGVFKHNYDPSQKRISR
jgi:hypothetical protein